MFCLSWAAIGRTSSAQSCFHLKAGRKLLTPSQNEEAGIQVSCLSSSLAFVSAGLLSQESLFFSLLPLRHPSLNEKFQLMCLWIIASVYFFFKASCGLFCGPRWFRIFCILSTLNPSYIGFCCLPWQKRCQQDGSFLTQPATHISNSHSSCQV